MTKDDPLQPQTPRQDFLTARQLAAILQVSESTVRRLALAKRIPSMRLAPRILRFSLESVRRALEENARPRSRRNEEDGNTRNDSQLSFSDLLPKI
ncbi:MAG: helix-turn-helix domain-containing protein [Pyrinomonadaceae bacterium]|nr:helix-turn-helix domain-containing protein [Pyrinomonadaceae bacterium]